MATSSTNEAATCSVRSTNNSGPLLRKSLITTHATDSSAVVGSNKPYAAMMQFGGERVDFPQLWGDIPARPYLPVSNAGDLQAEAEEAVLIMCLDHLRKAGDS
ncbi:hypothetical protein EJA71_20150 [Pseudomonas sp. PB106]|nr:hypothetical protein EJA71_20150 [Pseudomonas sp. PB106]